MMLHLRKPTVIFFWRSRYVPVDPLQTIFRIFRCASVHAGYQTIVFPQDLRKQRQN